MICLLKTLIRIICLYHLPPSELPQEIHLRDKEVLSKQGKFGGVGSVDEVRDFLVELLEVEVREGFSGCAVEAEVFGA